LIQKLYFCQNLLSKTKISIKYTFYLLMDNSVFAKKKKVILTYILLIISILNFNISNAQRDLNLDFEIVARDGNFPVEWKSSGSHIAFLDEKVKKHGLNSVRLELSKDGDARDESYYSQSVVLADKEGRNILLKGFIKTENIKSAGLFLRCQSGEYFALVTSNIDKMDGRRLTGTNDWTPVLLRLPFPPDLYQVEFGAFLEGKGKVWIDDLKLTIDGKLYNELPQRIVTIAPTENNKKTPYYAKKAAEDQKKREESNEKAKNSKN
jgi:hypothetical protein